MSRTEDRRRQKKAFDRGYYGHGNGLTLKDNPYKAVDTRTYWRMGWEHGLEVENRIRARVGATKKSERQ